MPHYFFDLWDGDAFVPDDEGWNCGTLRKPRSKPPKA
jgi:hypothetical protein